MFNELDLSNMNFSAPTTHLTGLPNAAYNSADFALFERDHVLAATWLYIANVAQLKGDGWLHPIDLLGLPMLIVRSRNGCLKVFHNVCSHRGMKLVETPGSTNGLLSCRYHGWCYGTGGELRATPHIMGEGKHDDSRIDKTLHGLKEIRSRTFAGMIFVNISGDAPEFEAFLKPVQDHWNEFDFNLYSHGGPGSSWEIELNANWKFCQENHVDGYHLPFVHPGLNSYSPLRNHYPLIVEGAASGQGSIEQAHSSVIGEHRLPANPNLSDPWKKGKAEFLSIFPNLIMGVQADHFWAIQLIPLAVDKTFERMDLYYFGEGASGPLFEEARKRNHDRMLQIFEEDRTMVEGMQRGRKSNAFHGGVFSPEMDRPTHYFNKIASEAIMKALALSHNERRHTAS